ncbi:MAG: hypothetical protein NTV77_03420 [Candidatus Azambacteria bacterium]|nr:hypothetical protein [Candidatus Azambacteria bacterium]
MKNEISKILGVKLVLPVNNVGRKARGDILSECLDMLNCLQLYPDLVWLDSSSDNKLLVQCFLSVGFENGWITKEEKSIYRCSCGTTEFLNEKENCLLLELPVLNNCPVVLPEYAEAEFRENLKFFSGKKILISRGRQSELMASVGGQAFGIDADTYWMCFLRGLFESDYEVETLVLGHRTIKHAVLSL